MEIEVKVENDHIQRVTSAKPLAALSELIWNAYDADASEVHVEFESGVLTKLRDNPCFRQWNRNPFEGARAVFSARLVGLGSRRLAAHSAGASFTVRKGRGDLRRSRLGNAVTWISSSQGKRFEIQALAINLKRFPVSEPTPTSGRGCIVEIDQVLKDFEVRTRDGFAEQIRDVFALQLSERANFNIIYDGLQINAEDAIHSVSAMQIRIHAS